MSLFDRAGNLLKGFLRKPVQALEEKLESAQKGTPRDLSDAEAGALERARESIRDAEIEASGKANPAPKPAPKPQAPAPAKPAEPGKKTPRSMGPDE